MKMLKSLEKLNFIIQLVENGVDVDLSFHIQELKQFKEDLNKLNFIMCMLEELFKNVDTIDIFGKHVFVCKVNNKEMQIDKPTQTILQELKRVVGGFNE